MRTSILLDDDLAQSLKDFSRSRGQSLSAFLAEAGRAAMRAETGQAGSPFELLTYGEGGTVSEADLDQPNALLAAEDRERYGKR